MKIAPPLGSELKDYLTRHKGDLLARLAKGEDGVSLGRRHCKVIDGLMSSLHAASCAAIAQKGTRPELAAIGSYGRGAVALGSDADVRVVVPSGVKHREAATAFAEALLYPLWDAGMSVGHQVMDPTEALDLAQEDLATATSLLDLRHLAGDRTLVTGLLDRAWSGLFSEGELVAFIDRLEEEAGARHARFGASVYLLEPDVKSGAGGLRDLDGARWAARARRTAMRRATRPPRGSCRTTTCKRASSHARASAFTIARRRRGAAVARWRPISAAACACSTGT